MTLAISDYFKIPYGIGRKSFRIDQVRGIFTQKGFEQKWVKGPAL
jgi:hypothetical protein